MKSINLKAGADLQSGPKKIIECTDYTRAEVEELNN